MIHWLAPCDRANHESLRDSKGEPHLLQRPMDNFKLPYEMLQRAGNTAGFARTKVKTH